MKNIICLVTLVVFSLSSYSCVSKDKGSSESTSGTPTWSQAVYCNIESAQVCVVAQSKDDCKKLGGKKVNACRVYDSKNE